MINLIAAAGCWIAFPFAVEQRRWGVAGFLVGLALVNMVAGATS